MFRDFKLRALQAAAQEKCSVAAWCHIHSYYEQFKEDAAPCYMDLLYWHRLSDVFVFTFHSHTLVWEKNNMFQFYWFQCPSSGEWVTPRGAAEDRAVLAAKLKLINHQKHITECQRMLVYWITAYYFPCLWHSVPSPSVPYEHVYFC